MTKTCAWLTESVRFSLLGVQDGAKVTWQSIMGTDAETLTTRPAQKLTIEEGPWDGGRLVITTQPNRIDITLTAMSLDPFTHPDLGAFGEVSSNFEKRISSIKLPTANRLAIGATLNTFLDSPEHSNTAFQSLVPEVQVSSGSSDFIFQLNRPKKLPRISGIVLNRLSKWSQLMSQITQYQNNQAQTKNHHLIQLEVDFNTHQESKLPAASSYESIITTMFIDARAVVSGERNG